MHPSTRFEMAAHGDKTTSMKISGFVVDKGATKGHKSFDNEVKETGRGELYFVADTGLGLEREYNFYYDRSVYGLKYVTVLGEDIEGYNDVPFEVNLGWYHDAEYTRPVNWNSDIMPCTGITLYAKWEPVMIELTFDLNYEGAPEPLTYTVPVGAYMKDQAGFEAEPYRAGFDFLGWYTTKTGEAENGFPIDQAIAESLDGDVVYASWKEGLTNYTVQYLHAVTKEALHETKFVEGKQIGLSPTELFVNVYGMRPDKLEATITLEEDPAKNKIIFYYSEREEVEYQVIHRYTDASGNPVEIAEFVRSTTDERVAAYAGHSDIPAGYYPVVAAKAQVLTYKPENNKIYFDYLPYSTAGYVVHHYYQTSTATQLDYTQYPEDATAMEQSGPVRKGYSYVAERKIRDEYRIEKVFVESDSCATSANLYLTPTRELMGREVHVHMYYAMINETEVSGQKTWSDNNDQDGVRPAEITVSLLANGKPAVHTDGKAVEAQKVAVSEADAGSWKFVNLPKYDNDQLIVYTVAEGKVDGYTASVDGMNITNTHIPETISISGSKNWIDGGNAAKVRPESITVNLFADGEKVDSAVVTAADNWEYSFDNLPKFRDHGVKIVYTVTEDAVKGYTSAQEGTNFTNTIKQDVVSVSGVKTWVDPNGTVHDPITINLLRDGVEVDEIVLQNGTVTYAFRNLPVYAVPCDALDGYTGKMDGHVFTYTVTEDPVEGYTTVQNGANFTNTIAQSYIPVTVNKIWMDNGAVNVEHPAITIRLLRNGTEVASAALANGVTSHTFSNQPRYDSTTGQAYAYTVTEDPVDGYTTTIDGLTIINTSGEPEKISITGTKTWDDDGRAHNNAAEVRINLMDIVAEALAE